jgi:alpha-tubulin suppressor-like RCC1 family protein
MHGTITSAICGGLVAASMLTITSPCDARLTRDEMAARIGTKRIAAGAEGNHTCFVRADGNVLCWGDNANGQIGDGTSGNVRKVPTATGITTAVDVAVGRDHSCALLATGAVAMLGIERFRTARRRRRALVPGR